MTTPPQNPRVLYLTTLYPAASHTFIQREVLALRALGMTIETASIRKPGDEHLIGQIERDEQARTFYVLGQGAVARAARSHLALLARNPIRYARALGLALTSYRPGIKGFAKQLAYFAEAGIIARHMRAQGVTHLHNHFGDQSANVAMLASALADVPFSFTIHGPTELEDPYGWAMDKKIARSKFTVCISEFARNFASDLNKGAHDDKLYIIHCGVFPETYASPPASTDTGLKLVFVGRLDPVKGVPVLFDALEEVQKTRNDVTVDIVGGGHLRDTLEARAKHMTGVTFHGYLSQTEVAARIAQADALVLPSYAEGLPVVYMEALASKRPVIATDVAGVSELVKDGETGCLIQPDDVPALVSAVHKLADTPQLRHDMGQAGHAAVLEGFDIREEAKRMKTLYLQGGAPAHRPPKSDP